MRVLWNFVQKRMVVEAVKYILGGEMSGLDIRSIFSLFKGREYSSFMVRVKSVSSPDEKKAIIDSFLRNYHFEENPESFSSSFQSIVKTMWECSSMLKNGNFLKNKSHRT